MNLINSQSRTFQKLVIDYFINKFNLKITKRIDVNGLYQYKNLYILSNNVINQQYKISLDTSKFSVLYICYKKLSFKTNNDYNMCYLDKDSKYIISKNLKYIDTKNIDDNIWIIGRKYTNEKTGEIYNNSLTLPIFLHNKQQIRKEQKKLPKPEENNINITFYRRKFLYNLKSCINENMYVNNMLEKSIFLDIEYANDIYDDFSKFPISENSSCLFMIGLSDFSKQYINFTASQLDKRNEADILRKYLKYIQNLIHKNGIVFIFHWSHADKSVIEKTLIRHPQMYNMYQNQIKNKIIYIDLLKIIKNTVKLNSYSLKYVLEKLFNIKYETDCKNGLDAMCSIIYNNIEIKNNKNKILTDFETTQDIIKYNKLDTVYLCDIIDKFKKGKSY